MNLGDLEDEVEKNFPELNAKGMKTMRQHKRHDRLTQNRPK